MPQLGAVGSYRSQQTSIEVAKVKLALAVG
jgi:hypothetical protein